MTTTEQLAARPAMMDEMVTLHSRRGPVGRVIYTTADGYYGVRIEGETRIDEYPADMVFLIG